MEASPKRIVYLDSTIPIENGSVVLDEPLELPEGTAVVVVSRLAEDDPQDRALKVPACLLPPEDLADVEAALRDCRTIDIDGC
jgi:hypothetical protein